MKKESAKKRVEDLVKNTKGNYITQGVSFNKTCPRQLKLLECALEDSVSFSGLVKEMLALRYEKINKNLSNKLEYIEEDNTKILKRKEVEDNWL